MKLFTIGYRARFPDVFEKYLGPSLNKLEGEFDIIKKEEQLATAHNDFISENSPAKNYNDIIFECTTPYLILCHEDVSFSPDIFECIQTTISKVPEFGVLGLVGCNNTGTNKWSEKNNIHEVDTLDSCFIVLRLDYGIKFDEKNFGGLHLYVEDFCGRLKSFGKTIHTIELQENSYINHHSATWNTLGAAWGDYSEYKKVFTKLYPNLKTT